jgi:hypothetical protein
MKAWLTGQFPHRGRALLILFLVLLPFNLLLFPVRAERLRALTGSTDPVLDVRFGYSPAEVRTYFEALGPEGRRLYGITQLTLDLAYPMLYSLLLSGVLAAVLARGFPRQRGVVWLAFVPFGMALMDVCENLSIVVLLLEHPAMPVWLAHMASAFTVNKWLLGYIGAAMLVVGLAAWGIGAVAQWRGRE